MLHHSSYGVSSGASRANYFYFCKCFKFWFHFHVIFFIWYLNYYENTLLIFIKMLEILKNFYKNSPAFCAGE
ncbi:MAG: hypothetical protein ACD_63C00209G0001 [uncultured bacterium]|nr:MAG: hypothetical protein ACD_63C00209G0001 [uncultured bacterium]